MKQFKLFLAQEELGAKLIQEDFPLFVLSHASASLFSLSIPQRADRKVYLLFVAKLGWVRGIGSDTWAGMGRAQIDLHRASNGWPRTLGDPVRLRLLSLIASHEGGEVCVCELMAGFVVSGPTISHHLKVLRETGLIEGDRRGTWIYYRVLPEVLRALSEALLPVRVPA